MRESNNGDTQVGDGEHQEQQEERDRDVHVCTCTLYVSRYIYIHLICTELLKLRELFILNIL